MRNPIFLCALLCCTSIARAQVKIYADPLAFNGKVKSVKMCTVYPNGGSITNGIVSKGPDSANFAYITYKDGGKRHIVAYRSPTRRNKSADFEQDMKDTNFVVTYNDILGISKYSVSKDDKGNKVFTSQGHAFLSGDVVTVVACNDKKVKSEKYYTDGKLTGSAVVYHDNDRSLTVERFDADGKIISRNLIAYDDHANPVMYDCEQWIVDEESRKKGITSERGGEAFKYEYDDKGNYTSCTFYYEGKVQRVHHRDIVYE